MTPQGAGRHCASCQKVVIDFTQKTDAEVLTILRAAAGGGTCGRFRENQLDRPLHQPVPARPSRWSTAVAATVALLAGRSFLAPEAHAQAPVSQHPVFGRKISEPDVLRFKKSRPAESVKGEISEVAVADSIFSQYLIPFEMVSLLLLAALIGAIVLARRD